MAQFRVFFGNIPQTAGSPFDVSASAASLTGVIAATGDLQFLAPFNLAGSRSVSLSGVASATGDVQSSTVVQLDISAQPISLAGAFSATGNLDPFPKLDLAGTRTATLSGALTISGDLQALKAFSLAQSSAALLSGSIVLSGDLQISTAAITVSHTPGYLIAAQSRRLTITAAPRRFTITARR